MSKFKNWKKKENAAVQEVTEEMDERKEKAEKKECGPARFFLYSSSVFALIAKCILLLLIPYAWLFVGGFLFETLLKMYDKATLVAVVALILLTISLITIVAAVVRFAKGKKK